MLSIFEESKQYMPGGVNSPVRAFKDVNIEPPVIKRLGMECIITNYFDPYEFLPAVGQGALGIEIVRDGEHGDIFRGLNSQEVKMCVDAERSFMRRLNGGCHVSIGAYAVLEGNLMHIAGMFQVGDRLIKKDIEGNPEDYIKLGEALAEKIISSS